MIIDKLLDLAISPPEKLEAWLSHQFSLTEKLKKESGEARLEFLKQDWTKPSWWDRYILGLNDQKLIHREILMSSNNTACWFARTIIPAETYQANRDFLDRLDKESLGVILFNEPKVKRLFLKNYAINSDCLEYYWLPETIRRPFRANEKLWLRFSAFSMPKPSTIYLVEIMLPGLMRVIK